ncbi:phosphoadenosine phosphosulfate reductase domain-containing protein [Anabaena azotica]|uniref:Phosphoadenosine phosphosulfate reductase family protein n=1 Tax=Anabaena azotica FACHB-119 TaxID=947527 RepID=A0ABR8D0S7_9NOST|nr:phosphoadenosine phosphosulfate reductase family protein [Anabaena azotica]MBD2499835.1 phosphoadenosine phosphosulfate reductase family protein [Anabaena azotica FACHB-119]
MLNLQLSLLEETRSPIEVLLNEPAPDPKSPIVVSYGGGRNSTALLILCWKLGIKPDLILFADTGAEKAETYQYIEMFSKWLVERGMPPITVVIRTPSKVSSRRKALVAAISNLQILIRLQILLPDSRNNKTIFVIQWLIHWFNVAGSQYTTLEEECLVNQALPSVAYGHKKCSIEWKVKPQNEFVENWVIENEFTRVPVRKFIGFHAAEVHRLIDRKTRQIRSLTDGIYRMEYPLMLHGLDNLACQVLIISVGLPIPPKSSCVFCPNAKLEEIRTMKPEDRAKAHLIEQVWQDGCQKQDSSIKGLGRRFSWRDVDSLSGLEEVAIGSVQESRQCHCID